MGRTRLTGEDITGSLAELVEQLGSIPLRRIRREPAPGTATEEDLIQLSGRSDRTYELIDGTLVEKAVGTREGLLSAIIARLLGNFVEEHDLGVVLAGDAFLKLSEGLVRAPDASYIPWDRWPEEQDDEPGLLTIYPELAVEVISRGNTRAEIARKLREFFFAGMKVGWVIRPKTRTAKVYTAPDEFTDIPPDGTLDAFAAVPGFRLAVADLFARTKRRRPGPGGLS
ncbi:MAG: Uma2 family endonuclease [Gemmataceae bacterium]